MSINGNADNTNIHLKNISAALNSILIEQKKISGIAEECFYLLKPQKGQLLHAQQSVKPSKPPPAFLRAEDVAKVLGISHRSADRVLRQLRQQAGLASRMPVSVKLFSELKGISLQDIIRILAD